MKKQKIVEKILTQEWDYINQLVMRYAERALRKERKDKLLQILDDFSEDSEE